MTATKKSIAILALFLLTATRINNSVASPPPEGKLIQIPVETIIDKIRGGLLGEMLGNLNGLPHEFQNIAEPGNVKNYTPSLPEGAWTDDDTDFEWVYIVEMQKQRNAFLSDDEITSIWKEKINKRIWCANRYARYLMDIDIKPPLTGSTVLNPWSHFNISGQFVSETFGLIAPAMPKTAAKIGLNYTRTTISGEPAQTTQFFTTMVSTAFVESDINKVLDAGIAALDPKSTIFQVVKDIKMWHGQYPDKWRETRRMLKEKYTHDEGNIRDFNGSELNTGSIIGALLYGEGDFAETLKLAFNFGYDADCNAATLGTIVGAMTGYRKMNSQGWSIVDRYKNTTRDDMPMDETITSFADRLIDLFEMINEDNGGKKSLVDNKMVYEIPVETPSPILMISSDENLVNQMKEEYSQQIQNDLRNGSRDEMARAAYMAVSTGMDKDLRKKYPRQWKEASYNLSGYWKVMNNVFQSGRSSFKSLDQIREKFEAAGFKKPLKSYSDTELYSDSEVWKDPKGLY